MQGTVPFMAYEILQKGSQIAHRASHDLESLFYVLIWICVNYTGPRGAMRKDWDVMRDAAPLGRWLNPWKDFLEVADTKLGQFTYANQFESQILPLFSDYFGNLKQCCLDLRGIFYPAQGPGPDVKHQEMLSILQRALDRLPIKEIHDKTELFDRDCVTQSLIDPFTPIISPTHDLDTNGDEIYDGENAGDSEDEGDAEWGESVEGDEDEEDEDEDHRSKRKKNNPVFNCKRIASVGAYVSNSRRVSRF
jgi:hypothetical protein